MKKIRYASLILSLLIMISSLSACEFKVNVGKKSENESSTEAVAEASSVTEEETVIETQTDKNGVVVTDKSGEPVTAVVKNTGKKAGSEDFFTIGEVKKSEKETISKDRIKPSQDEKKQDGKNTGDEKQDGKAQQEKKRDDRKVIESKEYTIKGRMFADGVVSEFKMAQKGEKFALITNYEDMPLGVIFNSKEVYLIDPQAKTYIALPMEALENSAGEDFKSLINGNFNDGDDKVKKEGTETVDGVELSYQEYENGSVSYFSGNTIVMTKSTDGTVVYIDEFSDTADESLFSEPSGFKRAELDKDTLERLGSK